MPDTLRNDLRIYDEVATDWWTDNVRWVRTLKNLVPARLDWSDSFMDWTGKEVLDLGCAGGFMAEALAERGARVTGIDPAVKAIAAARRRAEATGQDIRYVVGVGEDLPHPDATFDIVVCVDVLEHVSDLEQVLTETRRVLKPGGLFFYDTINRTAVARFATITVAEDILRLLPKGTHDPQLFITPSELNAAMAKAGLVPGAQTGLGPRGVNCRADFVFGTLPFKSVNYMGVARRPSAL